MNERLPFKINPFELCDRQVTFEGQLSLEELPRIVPLIENPSERVSVRFECAREEFGLPFIKSWVKNNVIADMPALWATY